MKLVIANIDIHQDAEGRFSLNDFHKAAGGNPTRQPSNFLRLDQTQVLITEISNSPDSGNKNRSSEVRIGSEGGIPLSVKKGGNNQGTYACKELVYAYAMWISAAFHLRVIRTFDEVVTGTAPAGRITQTSAPKLFPDYFKVARLIGCDRNAAAISANQAVLQRTGENVLALLGQTHLQAERQALVFNVSDLMPGISGVKMNKLLLAAGMQTNEGGVWNPTESGMPFCRIFDTGKQHSNGVPVQQIKWEKDVIQLLTLDEGFI